MKVIEATSLTKRYDNFKAVDDLTLQVKEGEIYGFLGLNGAGKTTTIRMFLDIVKATSGSIRLFGKKLVSGNDMLNKVGYLLETPSSYPELTVVENLKIYLDYRRLKDEGLIESIIQKLQLHKYRNVKAKHLSLGNKQRVGLAKALFHNPRLLILDEATNSLDPAGIVEIRTLLKTLANDGLTIFITSHILDEVSKIATTIGIIHVGKLIREIFASDLEGELRKSLVIKATDAQECLHVLRSSGYSFVMDKKNDSISSTDEKPTLESEKIARQLI